MAGTPPSLILVVGMHRSGTSLLGSLLPQIGIPLPGELIDADQHNPEGYFERRDITALQEQLLFDLDRWWPSQNGVQPLPLSWREHPASERLVAQLRQLLAAEMSRHAGPWAIKDPRTSLLLPLWRRVAAELGLPLKVVLCLRDPAEVSTSLLRRDRLSAGMTAWRAQQLWWRHTLQVLLDSQGLPLHVLHYGRWFRPPGQGGPERQLRELVDTARTPLTLLAYLVVAVLVLQIYTALLDVLEGLPLVPGLLELAGVVTVVRFALTRLVRSSDRQQVIAGLKSRWNAFRGQG